LKPNNTATGKRVGKFFLCCSNKRFLKEFILLLSALCSQRYVTLTGFCKKERKKENNRGFHFYEGLTPPSLSLCRSPSF
ncbi:MAG TPA: hypothetical protein PLG69_07810, partial [Candidatus Cloacimonas acidaminovorans]|nr:hypothetical protein [Candidatus Cloacimonas acidaminovorans]